MNVTAEIEAFNAGRDPERLKLKFTAMRVGAFAFLRGSCHLFYARMARGGVHKRAPVGWVCGDLHFENFGSYQGDNGLTYFDITDFDESALAPLSWDLVRFLASVRVGATTLHVGNTKAARLCEVFLKAYAEALASGKAYWVERELATGLVRDLLDGLGGRKPAELIARRTHMRGSRRVLDTDSGKALPASVKQRELVESFMHRFAKTHDDRRFGDVVDVARRIAGTGSLGVERYVILMRGKSARSDLHLLDLKSSAASSLIARLKIAQPASASHARRITTAQQRLQAVPTDFLHAVRFSRGSAVLRALLPSEDRVDLERAGGSMKALEALMTTMGRVVAWAHVRSAGQGGSASVDALIAFAHDTTWRRPVLDAAEECAAQVVADFTAFKSASPARPR